MPKELVLVAIVLPATIAAQSTTWTSFEDRRGHTMAATPMGGVVMYGGQSVTQPGVTLGDTNRLSTNNQTWTGSTDGPQPRSEHAMAATTIAAQPSYIVFGGMSAVGVPTNTTYRYDGSAWGDLTPLSAMAPTPRSGHSLATNPATQTMLLFGGFDGNLSLNDVWELDPATGNWTPHNVNGVSPAPRYGHSMAYDPGAGGASGRYYVFGGSPFRNDLWEFDPYADTWTQRTPASPPPGRRKAAMTFLPGQGELVLFGGLSAGGVVRSDTWAYDPSANAWRQDFPTTPPPARYEHAMSADNSGNNLILLGGTNAAGEVLEGTWLWSSSTFQWVEQLPTPADRNGVAMAYDSARNRHVVFGGRAVAGGADLDETWEIDGLNWRKRIPSAKPSARSDAGMAYDNTRSRSVLYGGRSQATGQVLGDTWEWNGSAWASLATTASPPAAAGVPLVFDSKRSCSWLFAEAQGWRFDGNAWVQVRGITPRTEFNACWDSDRGRLMVHGGVLANLSLVGDTWEWDGDSWREVAPSGVSSRQSSGVAYFQSQHKAVLAGGVLQSGVVLSDCYSWNGTAWQPESGLPARSWAGAQYLPSSNGRMILVGGTDSSYIYKNETLSFDGTAWSTVVGVPFNPGRLVPNVAYDPVRQRVVMFGGQAYTTAFQVLGDTWEFDGVNWTEKFPVVSPSPRRAPAIAFDVHIGKVLMFGGATMPVGSTFYDETWSWDGSNWQQLFPARVPVARHAAAMVSAGNRTIMFGGQVSSGQRLSEIWEWTGADWQIVDSGDLPDRVNYGAAYDARRDRVVAFGGMTTNVRANAVYGHDTWEWDGNSWVQRFPSNSPSARGWCKLTYDESRSRIILYGGADATNVFDDTWEWDGTNWLQQAPVASPPGSYGHDLTYDTARHLTIAYGGLGTWDYGPVVAATRTSYGAGCATSAGGPLTLQPLPWAGPWLGDRFESDFLYQPALSVGFFVWGFSNTFSSFGALPVNLAFVGSPSCFLRADALTTELILPGTTRYTSFVLPNTPLFLGAKMYVQAGFIDSGAPGTPIVTSNGLDVVFGQK